MAAGRKRIFATTLILLLLLGVAAWGLLDHYKMDIYRNLTALRVEQAGLQERQTDADGFRWVWLENSLKDQKPSLLMVHGFGASKENWLELALQLQNDFHLVLVDLPGHGQTSFNPSLKYDMDDQVRYLHSFVQAIGIQHFHMIGNSMGGGVSALYAGTYPDEVASITLLSPAGIYDVKSEFFNLVEQGINPLLVENEEEFSRLVQLTMEKPPFIPWPINAASAQILKQRKPHNQQIFADFAGAHTFDFKTVISHTQTPALIVWGRQDRVLDVGNAVEFQRLMPKARLVTLDGVGHVPMVEIPEETAILLRGFIESYVPSAHTASPH